MIIEDLSENGFVSLGVCLLGANLNSVSIRGFSSIAKLAGISGPDTFNQFDNPLGTQRPLAAKHSKEAGQYALESLRVDPAIDVRTFPEILLNVRDTSVIQVKDLSTDKLIKDVFKVKGIESEPKPVEVRVKMSAFKWPIAIYNPQIARVDGNHRLSQISQMMKLSDLKSSEYPSVPFAMHIGLTLHQETKLFVDINKNHKGMSTTLMLTMGSQASGTTRDIIEKRAEYLAVTLGRTPLFANMTDQGGDRASFKANVGTEPVITNASLLFAMKALMSQAMQASVRFRAEPDTFVKLISTYFAAVQQVFPEMWGNKDEYVLFKAIGLYGFSQLGGYLIDRLYLQPNVTVQDFVPALQRVALRVDLSSRAWYGVAGSSGGKRVFEKCLEAATGEK